MGRTRGRTVSRGDLRVGECDQRVDLLRDILGLRNHETSFARWVRLLHTRLVADKIGEAMVGWFSVDARKT